ncbi:MAG: phosphotransferase [Pseudomonas sp.]|nr:phosphotransferase [Pseudomonas sp.]
MNQPLHSHGLAGEQVAPIWATLTQAQLQPVLAQYPQLGALRAIDWHSPRPFSAAALVSTEHGQWFVKRHHPSVRSAAWLAEEHGFSQHLRLNGITTPVVQASATGATVISHGGWTYEVHARAIGDDLYRDAQSWSPLYSLEHAHAAGLALAQLHRAAEHFAAPARQACVLSSRWHLFTQPDLLAAVELHLQHTPTLARYLVGRDWRSELGQALLPAQQKLLPHLRTQPALWTHNDWHASNLLWRDGQVASVLDFGLCDRTSALYDLATALERNAIPWLELDSGGVAQADLATVDAMLDGYAAHTPLNAQAIAGLIAWLPVVHADFAISETEYFDGILGDRVSANIAWDDYLLRHASWFQSSEGQRLIEHLQQRTGDWA